MNHSQNKLAPLKTFRGSLPLVLLLLIAFPALLSSCEGYFGKKTDPSFIDIPVYNDRQVAYVPVQPVWDDFVMPVDVAVGYDELVYIVDGATSEIVCYDQAGNDLGRFGVPGVRQVVQDRTLDLLAIGTFDTLGATLSCIYRIELKSSAGYGLGNARIENKIVHPFYFRVNVSVGTDDLVSLNSIAVRADNSYYVARSGPGGSQIFGPDDAILIFDADDRFQTAVRISTNGAILNDYFKTPFALAGLAQPPQSTFVNPENDFVFCSLNDPTALKVQYIDVIETEGGIDYVLKSMIVGDTSAADGFLLNPNRFAAPVDVAISGDGTNYIFVVDSEKDSLYQFTFTGLEGVAPPAGSNSNKNVLVSFGGSGNTLTQFSQPSAVSYYREILYVADRGNQRVLRFRLTTDFD